MLRAIDECAADLSAQIDELRDVGHVQAGHPLELHVERTDLLVLTRTLVGRTELGSESQRVVVECEVQSLVGAWDAERLEPVVANLISNALKYSPDGGDVAVRLAREASEAVLAVEDHGLGSPRRICRTSSSLTGEAVAWLTASPVRVSV